MPTLEDAIALAAEAHRGQRDKLGAFLADAEALRAARLERVSLDDISRQAQPNPLHPQHGAHHHG